MMKINEFDKIIVANWKLNGSLEFIASYFEILNSFKFNSSVCGIICPPSVYLQSCFNNMESLFLGAQDCSNHDIGSYTGEVSASMIKESNCQFCIIGHSERRQKFNETNFDIKLKSETLINQGVTPIICVGETIAEKNNRSTKDFLSKQINESLPNEYVSNSFIIAYEPIWAIGSGMTPTLDEINIIHSFIKNEINVNECKVIYGGSVKFSNAKEIMNIVDVDGVLVGGASLDPQEFAKILKS